MNRRQRPRAWITAWEAPVTATACLAAFVCLAGTACGERQEGGDERPAAETPGDELGAASRGVAQEANGDPLVVFLGTSLTAGYGLASLDSAYPARVGRRMDDMGYRYRIANAGVSGDTSAGGRARLEGLLERYDASLAVLVVELGANDGLRGRDTEALYQNLRWIAEETLRRAPGADVVVASMEAPPNMGLAYATRFREVFGRAARDAGAALAPFLLEGVAGVPELNQADRIHPNAEGHEVLARNIWPVLAARLASRCRADGAC